jgi:hypothetical protein
MRSEMESTMKKLLMAVMTVITLFGVFDFADAATVTEGKVVILAVDPSDLVIQLDKNGQCGSAYFHVQRTNVNFREMAALAMTAFANAKSMALFVTGCANDRNIISHGYTGR